MSVELSNKLRPGAPWPDQYCNVDRTQNWSYEIECDDVIDYIEGICEQKSSGFTCISTKLLKIILKIIVVQFTVLINLVLTKSTFPTEWKTAITVIPKT